MPTPEELQAEIDALTARVTAIETTLTDLTGRVVIKPYPLPATTSPAIQAKQAAEQKALERQVIGMAQR